MTTTLRALNTRRSIALAAGIALVGVGLAGCTKPAPGVSVFSGTQSVNAEALCWSGTDTAFDPKTCAQDMIAKAADGGASSVVPVVPGDVIGISVDTAVADAGWYPVIGGNALTKTPITSTYFRFTYPELQAIPADGLPMMVVAGDNDHMRGVWSFTLTSAS